MSEDISDIYALYSTGQRINNHSLDVIEKIMEKNIDEVEKNTSGKKYFHFGFIGKNCKFVF